MLTHVARAITLGALAFGMGPGTPVPVVPLVAGLTLVSALHTPDGDRENVVIVQTVAPEGVRYRWDFKQKTSDGRTTEGHFARLVRANDMAGAPRLNPVFHSDVDETPGYTVMVISRAAYNRVLSARAIPYTVKSVRSGPLGALGAIDPMVSALVSPEITFRGTLTLVAPEPEPMPVLLNGQRVKLPALHLRGRFAMQDDSINTDMWVLADSANPVILRTVTGREVLQMVRIDLPNVARVEAELEHTCRVELPGIYFAFGSAELETASNPALDGVAAVMGRHPDWSFVIEGHTDSVGTASANQQLSVARAEAVRRALVEQRRVAAARLRAAGFGAARPREPNATIEGRARNRRVELVRSCAK